LGEVIMKKLLIISTVFVLCSCVAGPGRITERYSGIDNTREILLEPAHLRDSYIRLGLYKTPKMEHNDAFLIAVVKGTYNFAEKDSLIFDIDGKKVSLDPEGYFTDLKIFQGPYYSGGFLSSYNESSRQYLIDKELVKKLIEAKEVWVTITLSNGQTVQGEFSYDNPTATSSRPAFKRFYYTIWKE